MTEKRRGIFTFHTFPILIQYVYGMIILSAPLVGRALSAWVRIGYGLQILQQFTARIKYSLVPDSSGKATLQYQEPKLTQSSCNPANNFHYISKPKSTKMFLNVSCGQSKTETMLFIWFWVSTFFHSMSWFFWLCLSNRSTEIPCSRVQQQHSHRTQAYNLTHSSVHQSIHLLSSYSD